MFSACNMWGSCAESVDLYLVKISIFPFSHPLSNFLKDYVIHCNNYYSRFAISTTCYFSRNSFSFRFYSFEILLMDTADFDWVVAVFSSRILVTDTFLIWWIKLVNYDMAGVLEDVLKIDRLKTFENENQTMHWSWYLIGHLYSK